MVKKLRKLVKQIRSVIKEAASKAFLMALGIVIGLILRGAKGAKKSLDRINGNGNESEEQKK